MKNRAKKDFCTKINAKCPHPREEKEICFIIMAYDEFYSRDIEKILKEGIESIGYVPKLARDFKTKGSADMFCTKVCKPIRESRFCIADVTYDNTSVGYEWGLAEKFEKSVIATLYRPNKIFPGSDEEYIRQLKDKGLIKYPSVREDFPGDFKALTTIKYKDLNNFKKQLEENFDVKEDLEN